MNISTSIEATPVVTTARPHPGALLGTALRLIILLLLAVFMLVPLLWMLIAPTKTNDDLLKVGVSLLPGSLAHVGTAWSNLTGYQNDEIATWALNSVEYSLGSLVLTLLICVPAGYALATWSFLGRSVVLILTLVTMIVPA